MSCTTATGGSSRGVALMDHNYWYTGYLVDQIDDDSPQFLSGSVSVPLQLQALWYASIFDGYGMPPGFGGDGHMHYPIELSGAARAATIGATEAELSVAGSGGSSQILNLREGVERFLITDVNNPAASAKAQSDVFVFADVTSGRVEEFNHLPGGSNILYMDGHVEFERYPGQGAVSESVGNFHKTANNI